MWEAETHSQEFIDSQVGELGLVCQDLGFSHGLTKLTNSRYIKPRTFFFQPHTLSHTNAFIVNKAYFY